MKKTNKLKTKKTIKKLIRNGFIGRFKNATFKF